LPRLSSNPLVASKKTVLKEGCMTVIGKKRLKSDLLEL